MPKDKHTQRRVKTEDQRQKAWNETQTTRNERKNK